MFEQFPFLLLVASGFVAACSAVALRRAAAVFGPRLVIAATVTDAAATAAMLLALAWAWTSGPTPAQPPFPVILAGLGLAFAGGGLAGWGVRTRGLAPLQRWPSDRFERRQPYRTIRRPIALGGMMLAIGLGLLRGTAQLAVWTAGVIIAWNVALELGEWELRHRLPASRDYLARTPRYVPRRLGRRP